MAVNPFPKKAAGKAGKPNPFAKAKGNPFGGKQAKPFGKK